MNTVEKSKKIQKFLSYREGHTKNMYSNSLKKFLKWFDKKHSELDFDIYLKDIRLMEMKEKIATTDQYEEDILEFLTELKEKYEAKTIMGDIAVIKSMLRHHRIDLDNAFWDGVKRLQPGNSPVNQTIVSSQKELKEILTHANTRYKGIFITLITSGLRVGEVCSLKMGDIDLNYTYPRITIRSTNSKNKQPGKTRVSPEAKSCIMEWLKIRDNEIIKSYKRQMNFKTVPYIKEFTETVKKEIISREDRLFPFDVRTVERAWIDLLEKAKYIEKNVISKGIAKGERHKRNVHSLRKVFRTQYGKYNKDLAEYFMNHVSELERIYDDKSEEWLDQEYGKGLRYLTIFETVMDESDRIKRINKNLKDVTDENKRLLSKLEMIDTRMQLLEMKLDQEKMKNEIKSR